MDQSQLTFNVDKSVDQNNGVDETGPISLEIVIISLLINTCLKFENMWWVTNNI